MSAAELDLWLWLGLRIMLINANERIPPSHPNSFHLFISRVSFLKVWHVQPCMISMLLRNIIKPALIVINHCATMSCCAAQDRSRVMYGQWWRFYTTTLLHANLLHLLVSLCVEHVTH